MDYNVIEKNEYIPEWNLNRELEKENQIIVEWTWPTGYIKESCIDIVVENGQTKVRINYVKLVEKCISIKNFSVNGNKITTGRELLSTPGITGLSDEIKDFLIPKLRDIDEKN